MIDRRWSLVMAAALVLCLLAGSTPRIVGDGAEYIAQALNFARVEGPPLRGQAAVQIERRLHELEPAIADWSIEGVSTPGPDRTRDFRHFWFYALLATPAMWFVERLGVHPVHAFTATNLVLFGAALWAVVPRIGSTAALLIFAGPVVWWLDKPHTEVFTFSLLAIAFALRHVRPAIALVAAGAAATQNLPVSFVFAGFLALTVARRGASIVTDRIWITGAAAGGLLAMLHPAYTYWRHGTPSLLLSATRPGWPATSELLAVVIDPNMGLVGNYPAFLVGVAMAGLFLIRSTRARALSPTAGLVLGSAALFAYSFARTNNMHHGGTPSLSRYALWFVPLAIPLFEQLRGTIAASPAPSGWPRRSFAVLALASAIASLVAFRPAVLQNSREPTWLASWLWTRHPGWNNPLPEVFSEVNWRMEGTIVPVATPQCEKVLLGVVEAQSSGWPLPCYPADIPADCLAAGAMCYANRRGNAYAFVRAPGREGPPVLNTPGAWPPDTVKHVRALFDEWGWWTLTREGTHVMSFRSALDARTAVIGSDDRFLVVARPRGPAPSISLRAVAARLTGRLVDAHDGATLTEVDLTGKAGDLWTVPLSPDRPLQILALRSEGAH